MSFLPNPIACDVCKVIKLASNHWIYIVIVKYSITFSPWDEVIAGDPNNNNIIHLCGQVCAVKKLSEWMGQQAGLANTSTETATSIKLEK